MKFEFTLDETNIIMGALGRGPYEQVYQIIDNIQKQAAPQLQEALAAKEAEAAAQTELIE